ncbi:MAG: hypothetical protein QXL94_06445 [Candidatus Parvarchaeum sp.]
MVNSEEWNNLVDSVDYVWAKRYLREIELVSQKLNELKEENKLRRGYLNECNLENDKVVVGLYFQLGPNFDMGFHHTIKVIKDKSGRKTIMEDYLHGVPIINTLYTRKQIWRYRTRLEFVSLIPNEEMFNLQAKKCGGINSRSDTWRIQERANFNILETKRYMSYLWKMGMEVIKVADKTDNTEVYLREYKITLSNTTYPHYEQFWVGEGETAKIKVEDTRNHNEFTVELNGGYYDVRVRETNEREIISMLDVLNRMERNEPEGVYERN